MAVKNGTNKAEKLKGTNNNDTIMGFEGADELLGGLGNDSMDGGIDNDSINGEAGNDTLIGSDGDDKLTGSSGNDSLDGGIDNDNLDGGAGKDTLKGGLGVDTMTGGDGDDYYYVDNAKDVVSETNKVTKTGGNDTVETTLLDYKLTDNVENLVLIGTAPSKGVGNKGNNKITGNDTDNTLDGDSGNDSLIGGLGEDTLNGGLSMDTLVGGEGNDVYIMNNTVDKIVEESANGGDLDVIKATVDFNLGSAQNVEMLELSGKKAISGTGNALDNLIQEVEGGTIANNFKGKDGDDQINGRGGDDTLEGGTGNDDLDGGEGKDTVIYNSLKSDFEITPNTDEDGVAQLIVKYIGTDGDIDEGEDLLSNIEILQFSDGSTLNALDLLSGEDGETEIKDNSETETKPVNEKPVEEVKPVVEVKTGLPKDTRTYDYELPLTEDADPMEGSALNEKILGLGGADTLNGKEGNDYLDGGLGDDSLIGGVGDDYLLGSAGADDIQGDEGNDSIDGGDGDDRIDAGRGNNTIIGADGNDNITNSGENGSLDGGSGNDTLSISGSKATVHGGIGDDVLNNNSDGTGNLFYGDAGSDTLNGYYYYSRRDESLYGGDGDDTLNHGALQQGDAGNDILNGDGYVQIFIGGLDVDKITTGGDADIVQYDKITDSKVGAGNRDIITDFDTSSGAVIDLYRLSDALTFLGMKPLDGTKGAVNLKVDAPNKQTIVQIDMNGDKTPDMEIELTGIKILSADDFVLVKPV